MLINPKSSFNSEFKNKKNGRKEIPFPPAADKYIDQLNMPYKSRSNYRVFLSKFMKFISHNYMDDCPFNEIDFHKVKQHHIQAYVKSIKEEGFSSTYLFHLRCFLEFIGINDFSILETKKPKPNNIEIVDSFIKYLDMKKYSQTNTNKKHINLFIKFLKSNFQNLSKDPTDTFYDIEEQHLIAFERYLVLRADKKIITRSYVYSQLRSLSLFIKYLREKNITDLRYTPPRFLQRNPARRNDYIEEIELREMLQIISSTFKIDKFFYRNISIFLILMYTGCRPIEISNMNLTDIWKTDCTILLKSKKSKQRRVVLNREIFLFIKQYLEIRKVFSPRDDSLFVSKDGTRLSPVAVYDILYKINKSLYGVSKNPPVAFRHTFITNACESGSDLKTVANAAGHKHLVSTDYYREKSPARLLKNSINHDPILKFKEEFDNG